MSLLIQPWHIATRGRFDGEYGIATRGLVVLPPIVSKLPVAGQALPDQLLGRIADNDLEAVLRNLGWVGELEMERFGLAAAWSAATTLTAETIGIDLLEAVVSAQDPLVGLVTCLEAVSAHVSADGTVVEAKGLDPEATATMSLVVGVLEDKPGEGACQTDEDAEPC